VPEIVPVGVCAKAAVDIAASRLLDRSRERKNT
jgi:hypothetical protein